MGKISQAKKKERRKDFQKVKFKVGKTLPKNTNETRATFKARTLVLKQQFKTDKEGPVSHRNLSWKVRFYGSEYMVQNHLELVKNKNPSFFVVNKSILLELREKKFKIFKLNYDCET